jgi:hypothetical protein
MEIPLVLGQRVPFQGPAFARAAVKVAVRVEQAYGVNTP